MKNLILILVLQLSTLPLIAAECELQSQSYPELERDLNKTTICMDTEISLKEAGLNINESDKIIIEANGFWQNYVVELTSIKVQNDKGSLIYSGKGEIIWYPGDSYVILKD